jgi:HAE1 family hydrophobic/amphiphilic exporter-1
MLVGTVIGVLVIPGLYYLFARLDGGRKLLQNQHGNPLSERFEHESADAHDRDHLEHLGGSGALPHH